MTVAVRPLTPAVGAEIGGVDLARLDDDDFAALERAWHEHAVLLVRGQKLADDDLLAFSRRLGALDPPPNQERGRISPPGFPDIYVVSNVLDPQGNPIGALGAGEAVWHTDMSYLDTPPDASMLYALEIPPTGGNTWFCGMQAAYDELPADLKRAIDGKRIKHDGTYNSGGYLRQGVTPTDDPHKAPGAWHPAVLKHPANGRPTPQFLYRRLVAGRIRRGARGAVGAYRPATLRLRACMAAGRSRFVGQPLDHAPPRPVRRHGAPGHAPHPDQGQHAAGGLSGRLTRRHDVSADCRCGQANTGPAGARRSDRGARDRP
jgi:taurine dioxygenase